MAKRAIEPPLPVVAPGLAEAGAADVLVAKVLALKKMPPRGLLLRGCSTRAWAARGRHRARARWAARGPGR
uniref:Uncharacterized protein n=1 Tax=Tanacetum cinerariifolium TaxID=118510 RepID=A0A699UQ37_TANCI|nr:hypothetical protein [Tanacetum cinerariifolium]